MLTIDVKLNGEIIAQAELVNLSALADVSDYRLQWMECGSPSLGIKPASGTAIIAAHRRRQSAWALVTRAVLAILGQMIDPGEPDTVLRRPSSEKD